LRTGFAVAHRGRVRAQPAGFGAGFVLLVVLFIGVIAAVVIMTRRRARSGFGSGPSTLAGPPPRDPYPNYGPSYGGPAYGGPGYHSGMGAGTAGAIGAVGGGLLGYELGKMHGEQQQFRRDEMMYDQDRGGPYDGGDQGDWVVGQDSDFGDAGGGQQGSGDW
jgi:hypothetical protein